MFAEAIEKRTPARAVTIEVLIEDHFEDVYRFAARRLAREDAEDATLETFQAAIDQLHRIRGTQPLLWLLGIARRKVARYRRNVFRRREEPLQSEVPSGETLPLHQFEADAKLREIVGSLPADQRDALCLQHLAAYEKGKSYFVAPEVKP
jgi:DNA-directed RNA polymerase specialized sigma24 family protein